MGFSKSYIDRPRQLLIKLQPDKFTFLDREPGSGSSLNHRQENGHENDAHSCLGLVVAAAAWLAATPASAQSTTVTTAGDQFAASLTPGSNAVLKVSTITVTCNTSTTSGAVPAAPANRNASGPVTTPITNDHHHHQRRAADQPAETARRSPAR